MKSVLGTLAKRSALDNPAVPLTSATLLEWMGAGLRTRSGAAVTEDRVYGLTAYLRAISLMAGTMGALPMPVYRRGTRERVTTKTVLDNPNPRQTPFEFWQTTLANALGWGTGYGTKVRDRADVVREIWPLHPSRVTAKAIKPTSTHPDGLEFTVLQDDGTTKVQSSWEIFRIPFLAPNGLEGISPMRAAREALGVAIAAEDHSSAFYGNGARLTGIIKTAAELKKPQADALKARWREKHSGVDNAFDVAIMDNGAEFQPLSVNPVDAQLLESRKFSTVEIARMFGIPPHLLGDVERSTSWGTGIEQQTIAFVIYTLQPWLTAIEQRVTRELLPGGWSAGSWYAEFALDALLRGDSAARAAFYAMLIQWGVITRNEARVRENLEPLPGLDETITPSNMTIISVDGKLQPLASGDAVDPSNADV